MAAKWTYAEGGQGLRVIHRVKERGGRRWREVESRARVTASFKSIRPTRWTRALPTRKEAMGACILKGNDSIQAQLSISQYQRD